MKKRKYLFENDVTYTKEERNAFLESLKQYGNFKNEIYRSKKLKEISAAIGQMVESSELFTLKETDQWFDNMTVSRDLKELKDLRNLREILEYLLKFIVLKIFF